MENISRTFWKAFTKRDYHHLKAFGMTIHFLKIAHSEVYEAVCAELLHSSAGRAGVGGSSLTKDHSYKYSLHLFA